MQRPELKQYARERGQLFHFGSSETYSFGPPQYPDEVLYSLQRRFGEYQTPKPFVAEVRDVSLIGLYPIPFKRGNALVEPVVSERNLILNLFYSVVDSRLQHRSLTSKDFDCACLLFNSQSRGVFHWMVEDALRAEGVLRYEEKTGRRPTLIIPPNPKSWQTETLELLGFESEDWVEWDAFRGKVDRLVVPSVRRIYDDGVVSPAQTEWFSERMVGGAEGQVEASKTSSRVYISRDDAGRRRLTNEDDLMDQLGDLGFERHYLERMSTAQIVSLFNNANIIVAPHGAGLTNIMFATDASVIELRPNDSYSWVYYVLSEQNGLDYCYVMGDDDKEGTDFRVEPAKVIDAL
ncbi:glycosyltransferase family 61 protein [Halorhabdus utahensis]|nr:glycosyltransferase family 61 protein [Halorhabdus utahensis]